ncbi:mevalonate kinase [Methanopyrus sp. SNP6]|uniref:mevalonate kinase n=1 Tax=Methanopyrus sp. SNP6 TaxID=1937005 RepID=UPI00143A4A58|nr:mevalonate kinase [Methanopyrus sp. SNP6]
MRISVKAPLKAILAGEHAVVYGYPAVAVALDTYVRVVAEPGDDSFRVETELSCEGDVMADITRDGNVKDFRSESLREELTYVATAVRKASEEFDAHPSNLRIMSEAPAASGLGTSAAITAAVLLALAEVSNVDVSREEIRKLVREVELEVQGKASWTDATVVTYGGFVRVSGREFKPIEPERDPVLVVAHSQEPSRTGEMVRRVAEFRERLGIVDGIMKLIGKLVEDLEVALHDGDLRTVGELMNVNHGLLAALNVSTRALEEIVNVLRNAGALGAKVTGAGGGGCAVALFEREEDAKRAVETLSALGYEAFVTRPSPCGVKTEGSGS